MRPVDLLVGLVAALLIYLVVAAILPDPTRDEDDTGQE